jgi:hypothetical protein
MDLILELLEESVRPIVTFIVACAFYYFDVFRGEVYSKHDLQIYVIAWVIIYFAYVVNDIAVNVQKSTKSLERIQKDIGNMKG